MRRGDDELDARRGDGDQRPGVTNTVAADLDGRMPVDQLRGVGILRAVVDRSRPEGKSNGDEDREQSLHDPSYVASHARSG